MIILRVFRKGKLNDRRLPGYVQVRLILLLCLLFIVPSKMKAQWIEYTIAGRVISDNGQPSTTAFVSIFPVFAKIGFEFRHGEIPVNSDGRFVFHTTASRGSIWHLFVQDSLAGRINSHSPNGPPFLDLSRKYARYQGIPVQFGKNQTIDVGDVRVKFWYGDANLTYLVDGRKLKRDDWLGVWYRVTDEQGHLFAAESLAPSLGTKVDIEASQLQLSLPVGKWRVEFQRFDYPSVTLHPEVIARSGVFEITRQECCKTIAMATVKRIRSKARRRRGQALRFYENEPKRP